MTKFLKSLLMSVAFFGSLFALESRDMHALKIKKCISLLNAYAQEVLEKFKKTANKDLAELLLANEDIEFIVSEAVYEETLHSAQVRALLKRFIISLSSLGLVTVGMYKVPDVPFIKDSMEKSRIAKFIGKGFRGWSYLLMTLEGITLLGFIPLFKSIKKWHSSTEEFICKNYKFSQAVEKALIAP